MSYIYGVQHQQQDLFGGDIKHLMGDEFEVDELVKLEERIDWIHYFDAFEKAYKISGRSNLPVRQMFAMEMLKHIWNGASDEHITKQLKTNLSVMRFCGYKNVSIAQKHAPKSSSSMTHFRNRINKVEGLAQDIQKIHLKSMLHQIPKKKRKQYDQDSTVVDESLKYPNDVDLIASISETASDLLKKAREGYGELVAGMKAIGKKVAEKLKLGYHFGGKGKQKQKKTKEKLIKIGGNMIGMLEDMKQKITGGVEKGAESLLKKIDHVIEVGGKIIEQQKEMIDTGSKKVKNRIISLSKEYIRPIMKGKAGKRTQFGGKLQMGMIGRMLSCVVSLDWDNVHDNKRIKTGIEFYEEVCGKPPGEFGGDKGYREKDGDREGGIYDHMKKKGILNAIQGTKEFRELDREKRKSLYKRRAFTEPLIGNIKGHRGCNNNKHKKENTEWKLIMGSMTSNILRVYA